MIEAYFLQIETILQSFPNIRFVSLTKKIYNTNQGRNVESRNKTLHLRT
jgi:hypothetical protein